jgi:hypothetical protein
MIRTMVRKRSKSFREVTVVNFSAGVDYHARLQQIFGVERSEMRTYKRDFGISQRIFNGSQESSLD